jgi:uncharacterized membrane protein/ketosteroid isomerase-like protein
VVHFSITLIIAFAALHFWNGSGPEAEARIKWAKLLISNWALGALIVTVGTGFYAYFSVGHDAPSHAAMTEHRNWALGTSLVFIVAWMSVRWARPAPAIRTAACALVIALVSVTGFKGGELVYRFGLGVQSLPEVSADGHDHDHSHAVESDQPDISKQFAGSPSALSAADHGDHDHGPSSSVSSPTDHHESAGNAVETTVDAFADALRNGNEPLLHQLLHEDVLILEGGGIERSLEDYAAHHMQADMKFMSGKVFGVIERYSQEGKNYGYVITRSAMPSKDKERSSVMSETMILSSEGGQWKIVHIHWSNT